MADMEAALAQLDKASNEPLYQTASSPDQPVNSIEVQAATIFDATVLSQVSKVSKPVIGVSKVLPVFLQFFTFPFYSSPPLLLFSSLRYSGHHLPASFLCSLATWIVSLHKWQLSSLLFILQFSTVSFKTVSGRKI